MREASELMFYLTAYPWFLICFLLILALFVSRTRRGYELQFCAERYFAWRLLRDLDVHVRTDQRWHESSESEVDAMEVLDVFYYAYYDHAPNACVSASTRAFRDKTQELQRIRADHLKMAFEMGVASTGSGASVPPRDGLAEPPGFLRKNMGENPHA